MAPGLTVLHRGEGEELHFVSLFIRPRQQPRRIHNLCDLLARGSVEDVPNSHPPRGKRVVANRRLASRDGPHDGALPDVGGSDQDDRLHTAADISQTRSRKVPLPTCARR